MAKPLGERIAALEPKVDALMKRMDEQEEADKTIIKELRAMREELARYKGVWGGIVLVVSALGAVVSILWKPIMQLFGKNT